MLIISWLAPRLHRETTPLHQSHEILFLDGDRCGSNSDELHPSFEHWGCAAHHNSLPQHTCVGRRTLPATFWQSCELQSLDRGEDSGGRPPGATDTKGWLLGMGSYLPMAYKYSQAKTSQSNLSPKSLAFIEILDVNCQKEELKGLIHLHVGVCMAPQTMAQMATSTDTLIVFLTFRWEMATGIGPTSSSRPRTRTYSP